MTEEKQKKILNASVYITKWTIIAAATYLVALVGYVLITDVPKERPCSCECRNDERLF